jgi:hypothetical protein
MCLLEVHAGLFDEPFQLEAPPHNGWTLITACSADLPTVFGVTSKLRYNREMVAKIAPLLLD